MKKLLTLVGVLAISVSLSAQGTVNFANAGGGVNAPFYDIGGVDRLAGAEFMAQLFAGPDADSMVAVGNATAFLTGAGAGYFNGGVIAIDTVAPGADGTFQVKAWQTLGGTIMSHADAIAAGANFGESNIFVTGTGGVGAPPTPPLALVGLQSFELVPEPSTYALLALGAGALMLIRRRKA